MNLTPAELKSLTGAVRSDAQARELAHLGIPFTRRRDGTIVVLKIHVEHGQTTNKEDHYSPTVLP